MALIGLNVAIYLYQFFLPAQAEWIMLNKYGVVPAWITGLGDVALPPGWFPRAFTLVDLGLFARRFFAPGRQHAVFMDIRQ